MLESVKQMNAAGEKVRATSAYATRTEQLLFRFENTRKGIIFLHPIIFRTLGTNRKDVSLGLRCFIFCLLPLHVAIMVVFLNYS